MSLLPRCVLSAAVAFCGLSLHAATYEVPNETCAPAMTGPVLPGSKPAFFHDADAMRLEFIVRQAVLNVVHRYN